MVIFIHGILRFVEDWLLNLEALAQDHQVYAVDLVGFGETDKPEASYTVDYVAGFFQGLMDALEIERASLVGHSLGGGVALSMAQRRPERVERLVLVASAGFGREIHFAFRLASVPGLGELLTWPNRPIIAQALKRVVWDPAVITNEMVDLAQRMFYLPGARKAFLSTLRAGMTLRGIRPELVAGLKQALPTMTIPTLVLWGEQDPILPVKHARLAMSQLPNVRGHIFEQCGHFPMFEHPETFNRLVRAFLASTGKAVDEEAEENFLRLFFADG